MDPVGSPPIEGVNGWLVGFAITSLVSICASIWSEYQRRCERRDNKEQAKSVAEIQSEQARTQLEFQSVKDVIASLKADNDTLRQECKQLREELRMERENSKQEREHSRVIETENNGLKAKVKALEDRIAVLEKEVKSLEESRDQARKECPTTNKDAGK